MGRLHSGPAVRFGQSRTAVLAKTLNPPGHLGKYTALWAAFGDGQGINFGSATDPGVVMSQSLLILAQLLVMRPWGAAFEHTPPREPLHVELRVQ